MGYIRLLLVILLITFNVLAIGKPIPKGQGMIMLNSNCFEYNKQRIFGEIQITENSIINTTKRASMNYGFIMGMITIMSFDYNISSIQSDFLIKLDDSCRNNPDQELGFAIRQTVISLGKK